MGIEKPSKVNSSMKMFLVLALAAVALAEPEADPAFFYSSGLYSGLNFPWSSMTQGSWNNPQVYNNPMMYKNPAFYKNPMVYRNPLVYKDNFVYRNPVIAAPFVSNYAAPTMAAPAQVVSNYGRPDQFTAQATPFGQVLGLPKYIAKNGPTEHVVQKREAEADADLVFSRTGVASVFSQPAVYNQQMAFQQPAVYNQQMPFQQPAVYNQQIAFQQPAVYNQQIAFQQPAVYKEQMAFQQPAMPMAPVVSSYATPAMPFNNAFDQINVAMPFNNAGVYRAFDQSNVAITPFGETHPSNIGVCFNNMGQQVPC